MPLQSMIPVAPWSRASSSLVNIEVCCVLAAALANGSCEVNGYIINCVLGAYPDKACGYAKRMHIRVNTKAVPAVMIIANAFSCFLLVSMMLLTLISMSWMSFAIRCSIIVCGPRMITNSSGAVMVRTYALSAASTMTLIWG